MVEIAGYALLGGSMALFASAAIRMRGADRRADRVLIGRVLGVAGALLLAGILVLNYA